MNIRSLTASDWPEVMDIERLSYEHPWGEEKFRKVFRDYKHTVLVAEQDCEVIGYLVYERMTRRFQLHSVAVHPKYRRCQTASKLMVFCKARAEHARMQTIDAEVREHNVPMQLFLQSQGFRYIDTLGEYDGTDEDCYQFRYQIPQPCGIEDVGHE